MPGTRTIRKSMAQGALLVLMAPAAGASDEKPNGVKITLPSGAEVFWQETLHDTAGGQGLTSRFRFVMPDLAQRVPSTSGPASDFAEEEERGPIDIDTESGEVAGEETGGETGAATEYADTAQPDAEAGEMAEDGTEQAADTLIEAPALPAAPDVLAQDPVHQDVVWLCENWALPRIASPAPRPAQIVISLADKAIPFAAYDPDVVQLFEAFRLPPDRNACEWEPW